MPSLPKIGAIYSAFRNALQRNINLMMGEQTGNPETKYQGLIDWLEKYYKEQGNVATYRGLEDSSEFAADVNRSSEEGIEFHIDPMLPIDLVKVEIKEILSGDEPPKPIKLHYYTLFWIVIRDDKTTQDKLQFYRFYLSRISPSKAVEAVIIIPNDLEPEICESLIEVANNYKFGLWSIDVTSNEPSIICTPKDMLQRMEDELRNPPDQMEHFGREITDAAAPLSLFFDRYIREAVEALAGVTAKTIGKRYIGRKLLDTVFELRTISYASRLQELVTNHLIDKDDDYDFVSNTFNTLWSECEIGVDYSNFLKVFEPPLMNIYADQEKSYRDHYLHQFHVFILGLYIIDQLHEVFPENIDKQWLITSSSHDMAYPLQLYDNWAQRFFNESLGIPDVGVLDMKSSFIDGSLLSSLGYIVNGFCKMRSGSELTGNWLQTEKPLVQFFHTIITTRKHHCVLSSLYLLKQAHFKNLDHEIIDSLFAPCALSIALHHDVVWNGLPVERRMNSLEFNNNPLTFLLMYCDAIQEWGRPKANLDLDEKLQNESFVLSEIAVNNGSCLVTIKAPTLSSQDDLFKAKGEELDNLSGFLKSSTGKPLFKIKLIDKHDSVREFEMRGKE